MRRYKCSENIWKNVLPWQQSPCLLPDVLNKVKNRPAQFYVSDDARLGTKRW